MEAAQRLEPIASGGGMKVADLTARRKQAERSQHAAQVLDAWDRQNPCEKKAQRIGKSSTLDTDAETRRKAKSAL